MNDAANFRTAVRNAKDEAELSELFDLAKRSSFLSHRVDREKFEGFESLSLLDRRHLLWDLVNSNTLYVNYSDVDNGDYDISLEDKRLNRLFYDG